MLGVRTYSKEYIDQCKAKVASDVGAYRQVASAASSQTDAVAQFEPAFFNNMVLVLDSLFVHRLRTVEGKDGNALNEVRVICESIQENGGVLKADKSIKLTPEKSVLGLEPGKPIELNADGFEQLAEAYFGEIERKFS